MMHLDPREHSIGMPTSWAARQHIANHKRNSPWQAPDGCIAPRDAPQFRCPAPRTFSVRSCVLCSCAMDKAARNKCDTFLRIWWCPIPAAEQQVSVTVTNATLHIKTRIPWDTSLKGEASFAYCLSRARCWARSTTRQQEGGGRRD